jgi:fido (protein-threonine AMPylation protein)
MRFISNLWQAHLFGEGNTRTIAVFLIKYLRTFGFAGSNDLFEQNSWYFRNALVLANYRDPAKKIDANFQPLTHFFENLLFNARHPLRNRDLLIG